MRLRSRTGARTAQILASRRTHDIAAVVNQAASEERARHLASELDAFERRVALVGLRLRGANHEARVWIDDCDKEPYIARAITSVLAQTKPVDEIIIVDDASTDGSLQRIKAFQDPRIRVLRRTDPRQRGLPATRNLGIRSAASRWIALLDADDCWHEDFIEENEKLMAQASDRMGFLFTGWESVWPDGRVTRDAYSARHDRQGIRRLDLDSFVSAWLDLDACPVFPSGVVIRRDTMHEAGLFQERCRRGEDKEMWLRLLAMTDALSSPRVCSFVLSRHTGCDERHNHHQRAPLRVRHS